MSITIYLDEAGYTGPRMMDAQQRAFVVAAHSIPEAACRELLKDSFGKTQAAEIKHVNVRKGSGQKGVLRLLDTIRSKYPSTFKYAIHKRYSLFIRFFDMFVEPAMHRTGMNAYGGSFNISFCNVAYLCLNTFEGPAFLEGLLTRFEKMMRFREVSNFNDFWEYFDHHRSTADRRSRRLLEILEVGKGTTFIDYLNLPDGGLDLAFPTTVATVAHWRRNSVGPFVLIHDESSEMAKRKDLWSWLSSPEQQEATLGFGDYRDMILPLNVTETTEGRSHDYAGLQVADILAGAMFEVCQFKLGAQCDPEYAQRLIASDHNEVQNNIWPEPNWKPPSEPKAAPGRAQDPLDYIAKHYFSRE